MVLYEAVNSRTSELQDISSRLFASRNEQSSTILNETPFYNSYITDNFNLTPESNKSLTDLNRTSINANMTSTTISHVTVKSGGMPHNQIMLLILLAIFTTISISISLAVLVFCRKKNAVFMLQKCEQESDVEMDDLPTEIDNSDTESEDINTAIMKSESYPGLSKYSRNSYPKLSRYASENKSLQSGSMENREITSASLMPLLRRVDKLEPQKCKKCSVKRTTVDQNYHTKSLRSIRKSNTFPSHQESHSLLDKPGILLHKESNFGSISIAVASKQSKEKRTVDENQIKGETKVCSKFLSDNSNRLNDEDDVTLTQTDSHLDFHGKLEINL